ncbi:MAG: hypothetical protein GY804_11630 [Alphaproteobacteria bacterium]|nr:hypothetical protein [Alphaproteobacteria bacterium]
MIVKREWAEAAKFGFTNRPVYCTGWYLFGIIPLYIKKELIYKTIKGQ